MIINIPNSIKNEFKKRFFVAGEDKNLLQKTIIININHYKYLINCKVQQNTFNNSLLYY